ncbi:MAG: GAF domain-containing protein [Nitrospira sp.]|nr:GAF domain-containing protein [Nitrospira sp.]
MMIGKITERTTELSKANVIPEEQIIQHKHIEEKLRQQNEYLTALHETALGLMNRLELDDLLEAIITRAGTLLGTSHGFIRLLELEAGEPVMVQKVGVGLGSKFMGYRSKSDEGLVGKIWRTGQPLAVEDYPNWPERSPSPGFGIVRALIGAPLKSDSQVVGVIGLACLEEGRAFGDNETDLLNRFAQPLSKIRIPSRYLRKARTESNPWLLFMKNCINPKIWLRLTLQSISKPW